MAWVYWCGNPATIANTTTTVAGYSNPAATYSNYANPMVQIWQSWVGTNTAANTVTNVSTPSPWVIWVADSTPILNGLQLQQQLQPAPTAAELVVLHERARLAAEAHRQQTEEMERERKAAHVKAMELLRANLTKKQQEDLDKRNWFIVEGGKSKKSYRIRSNSYAGNITELRGDKEVARYCVHAEWSIPLGDQLLAQALYLRLDEEYIISRANRTALAA